MLEQQNASGVTKEDWSAYKKLDFDPQALPDKVKWWLRSYLAEKYPGEEKTKHYEVVRWAARVSWYSKDLNMESLLDYLWNLMLIYEAVPTIPIVNRLYGEIGMPAYTKIWPILGKEVVWTDLLLEKSFNEKMDERQMLRIFGEKRVDDGRQKRKQREKSLGEVADCKVEEDSQDNMNETDEPSEQLAEEAEQEVASTEVTIESFETCLAMAGVPNERNQIDMAKDLREELVRVLPEWPENLVEWLAVQIEFLRQRGMDSQREQSLLELVAKQGKANYDYVLLAMLERPSMQTCLTKTAAQRFSQTGMIQLLYDLMITNDNVPPRPVDLEQVAGLGLPTLEEIETVVGTYRGWRRKIVNVLKSEEIRRCELSEMAHEIVEHTFAQEYRLRYGKVQRYRQDDGRLVLFVTFDNGKCEQIVLELPEGKDL